MENVQSNHAQGHPGFYIYHKMCGSEVLLPPNSLDLTTGTTRCPGCNWRMHVPISKVPEPTFEVRCLVSTCHAKIGVNCHYANVSAPVIVECTACTHRMRAFRGQIGRPYTMPLRIDEATCEKDVWLALESMKQKPAEADVQQLPHASTSALCGLPRIAEALSVETWPYHAVPSLWYQYLKEALDVDEALVRRQVAWRLRLSEQSSQGRLIKLAFLRRGVGMDLANHVCTFLSFDLRPLIDALLRRPSTQNLMWANRFVEVAGLETPVWPAAPNLADSSSIAPQQHYNRETLLPMRRRRRQLQATLSRHDKLVQSIALARAQRRTSSGASATKATGGSSKTPSESDGLKRRKTLGELNR